MSNVTPRQWLAAVAYDPTNRPVAELARAVLTDLDKTTKHVRRLRKAARGVTECEDDLEDAILTLRAVLDNPEK